VPPLRSFAALGLVFVALAGGTSRAEQPEQACSVHWILTAIESRDAAADAEAAIRRGAPRFIGVYGFALSSPGLEADPYCLQDSGLLSILPDTGDDLRCEEHGRLQSVARSYARTYNERLLAKKALAVPSKCLSK
jgi:hypothetical protein